MALMKEQHTMIIELLDDGLSVAEIASRLGISEQVVEDVAQDLREFLGDTPGCDDTFLSE